MRVLQVFLLACIVCPVAARCEVLLFPHGTRTPGEIGPLTAGAQVALTRGPESVWYNPAGLAMDSDSAVTAGAEMGSNQSVSIGGTRTQRFTNGGGFIALSSSPTDRRSDSRFAYGIFLAWPSGLDIRTRTARQRQIDPQELPPVIDTGGLDNVEFGIDETSSATGQGNLRVLTAGVGVGYAPAKVFRIGIAVQWERVEFFERQEALSLFTFDNPSGGESFEGSIHGTSEYEGVADRLVTSFGLQANLFRFVTIGLRVRLPSRTMSGRGRVFLRQSSQASRHSDTMPDVFLDDISFAGAGGLPFELRTPLVIQFGIGVVGQSVALELDFEQSEALPAYTVLPLPDSAPPSTVPVSSPPFETRLRRRLRWSAGFSIALSPSSLFLAGYRDDRSAVPDDDPVFRSVDLGLFSIGWVYRQGQVSGSLGMDYQYGNRAGVSFPTPLGDRVTKRHVRFEQLTLRFGGTIIF